MSADADPDEAVPKLPRGRGLKFSGPEMFRVLLTLMTLVGVVLLARPCANAVSGFVMGMDGSGSAVKAMPKPGNVDQPQPVQYEQLKADMTEAELKAAIERAKARNAESDHSAAGRAGNAGSGAGSGSAAVGSGSSARH